MNDLHDNELGARLAQRLTEPLPGSMAQRRFSPQLCFGRHDGPAAHDARQAAVIALLYPHEGRWHVSMTLRPETMADHAGQVCFPGGSVEAGETSRQAALRELCEELNVGSDGIEILGPLSNLYVFVTNYLVTPWLAVAQQRPDFQCDRREVAELVELPLDALLDEGNYGHHTFRRRGIGFQAPHIAFGRHRIWGATSMMLGELIALLNDVRGN